MVYYYTYQTKNLVNNKIYVGIHTTKNLNDGYIGSGNNLKRAINKYGKENFVTTILSFFDTLEEMVEEEIFLVDNNWIKRKDNYNVALGGRGGNTYYGKTKKEMDVIKKKISDNHFGIKPNDETRKKLSLMRTGEGSATFRNKKSGLPLYITFNHRYKDRNYVVCIKNKLIGRYNTLDEAIIEKNKNI